MVRPILARKAITRAALAFTAILLSASCLGQMPDLPSTQPAQRITWFWTPTPEVGGTQPATTPSLIPSATFDQTAASGTPTLPQPTDEPPSITVTDLYEIWMVSPQDGWAIAQNTNPASILRTSDGGFTWTIVTPPQPFVEEWEMYDWSIFRAIIPATFFLDALHAWVIYGRGGETIWRTTDGGNTWQASSPSSEDGLGFPGGRFDLFFISPSHGWLVSFWEPATRTVPTGLYQTVDGGVTWEMLVEPSRGPLDIFDMVITGVVFSDALHGWMSTHVYSPWKPWLLVTHDGGLTWEEIWLPPPLQDPQLFDFDTTKCVQFGLYYPTLFSGKNGAVVLSCDWQINTGDPAPEPLRDYIYRTVDGGVSWTTYEAPSRYVVFVSQHSAWSVVETDTGLDIYHSIDRGATWSRVGTTDWEGEVFFFSDSLAYAIAHPLGENPDTYAIILMRSIDGCRTWETITPEFLQPESP